MHEAIVRSATQLDLAGVLNLYQHLHPHEPPLETMKAERVWKTLLTSDFMTVIVAQTAELLVSSCTLAVVPNLSRGARSYGVIENVVTHAQYRNLGLGRRVHTRLMLPRAPIATKSIWRPVRSERRRYGSTRAPGSIVGKKPTSKCDVPSLWCHRRERQARAGMTSVVGPKAKIAANARKPSMETGWDICGAGAGSPRLARCRVYRSERT